MPFVQGVDRWTKDNPRFYGRIPLLHSEVTYTFIVVKRNCTGGVFFMRKLMNTKTLTAAAMLSALGIVLGFFKIPINQLIEIRFGALPVEMAGQLFGPAVAGVVGGIVDIGGYLVKPTGPFFPGFTFSSIVGGIIFAISLTVSGNLPLLSRWA